MYCDKIHVQKISRVFGKEVGALRQQSPDVASANCEKIKKKSQSLQLHQFVKWGYREDLKRAKVYN